MKRFIFLLITCGIISGCGSQTSVSPNSDNVVESQAPVEEKASMNPSNQQEQKAEMVEVNENVLFDATVIAGKSPEKVSSILGDPLLSQEIEFAMGPDRKEFPVTHNFYTKLLDDEAGVEVGRVEIMFVDGAARRIRLNFEEGEYNKDSRTENAKLIGLDSLTTNENGPMSEVALDSNGFYSIEINDIGPFGAGTVLVVTDEKYK